MTVLGTCSLCGGPVVTPDAWLHGRPVPPWCYDCRAVRANPYGPVVEMRPAETPKPEGEK